MKDFRFVSLLAVLVLGGILPAVADEVKIGFVNTQRIFRDAPAAIKAGKKLDQEFGRRDQELQNLAKDVQARQDYLQNKGSSLSDAQRQQKERELADLGRDLQRKQQQFREDLNARQNEENAASSSGPTRPSATWPRPSALTSSSRMPWRSVIASISPTR